MLKENLVYEIPSNITKNFVSQGREQPSIKKCFYTLASCRYILTAQSCVLNFHFGNGSSRSKHFTV